MKITKSKLKEFKSFSNRFHNSDTIRIKDKNEYNRIMKYLDKTKWPYYDIGGGKGAFHIQFDNTKDTMKIRGILQKKGFKIIDSNTEGKLREMIREVLKEARLNDIVPDIIFTAAQYTNKKLDHISRRSWDSSESLTKEIMQSIPMHKWASFRKDVNKLLKQHSIRESDLPITTKKGKTVTVVHKSSGKELVITDTPSARKKYKRMGYLVNEAGIFSDYHELNRAYMDDFIKNYKKLNNKNLVKKSGGNVYGFRKGDKEAHWKYDDNFKLHYDIKKVKALGLINSFNRVKQNHPWG